MLRLAAACLLVVTAACGDQRSIVADAAPPEPDAPRPDAPIAAGTSGGTIVVFAEPEGYGVLAELYDAATPDLGTTLATGDDHCDVRAPGPAGTVVDRDAGPSIAASGSLGTITATREAAPPGIADFLLPEVDHTGPTYYYFASGVGGDGFSSTWTITTEAGSAGTVAVPAALVQPDSMILHTAGQPGTVDYTGGDGAAYILIQLAADGGTARCYPAAGTTSFTVPAAVLDAIVVDAAAAGVNVFAYNRSVVTLAGRQVVVAGVAQNLD